MTSPASEAATTPRRAILWAEQPTTALLALGAAFDDLVVGSLDDVRSDLAGATPDTTLLLAGPIPEPAVRAVVDHLVTLPGSRLALSVAPAPGSVPPEQLGGLRILGDGRLGDLPVTWWAASDAPEDLGPVTDLGPGGSATDTTEAGFVASAQLLRAQRDLAESAAARDVRLSSVPATSDTAPPTPLAASGSADPGEQVAPPPRPAARGRAGRSYRLLLALLLLSVGVALGILVSQIVDGDADLWSALLVVLAVVVLALAWLVRAVHALTTQLGDLRGRTQRVEGKFDRGLARIGKRVEAGAERTTRSLTRIRQLESRLAVLSTAVPGPERPRPRPVRDGDQPADGSDPR